MSAIVYPKYLLNLFSTFTKLSTCCSFRFDGMITGKCHHFLRIHIRDEVGDLLVLTLDPPLWMVSRVETFDSSFLTHISFV